MGGGMTDAVAATGLGASGGGVAVEVEMGGAATSGFGSCNATAGGVDAPIAEIAGIPVRFKY